MRKTILTLVLLSALGAGGILLATGQRQPVHVSGKAARSRAQDSALRGIVYAQPFRLEQPATHWWRQERPTYTAGWLLVLDVDPTRMHATARPEPTLFVGHEVAERVNHPFESGRLVVIVPSPAGEDGFPTLDLAQQKIWFGEAALPEQTGMGAIEQAFAAAGDAQPFTEAELAEARAHAGPAIVFDTRGALDRQCGSLILEHAPEENDLAQGLLRTP
jgi:hypothetical protein